MTASSRVLAAQSQQQMRACSCVLLASTQSATIRRWALTAGSAQTTTNESTQLGACWQCMRAHMTQLRACSAQTISESTQFIACWQCMRSHMTQLPTCCTQKLSQSAMCLQRTETQYDDSCMLPTCRQSEVHTVCAGSAQVVSVCAQLPAGSTETTTNESMQVCAISTHTISDYTQMYTGSADTQYECMAVSWQ